MSINAKYRVELWESEADLARSITKVGLLTVDRPDVPEDVWDNDTRDHKRRFVINYTVANRP